MSDAKTIRVLLVPRKEGWSGLTKAVDTVVGIERVGVAASVAQAIALASELMPNVILLEVRTDHEEDLAAVKMLTDSVPYVQVMLLAQKEDLDFLRRAMLAGARDFLAEPFTTQELVQSVSSLLSLNRPADGGQMDEHPSAQGGIIACFSPKGGVGTSTIAANLAVAFKELTAKKVALVDCDLSFGNLDVFLDLDPEVSIDGLLGSAREMEPQDVKECMLRHSSGVDLLAAPTRYASDLVDSGNAGRVLNMLASMYDIVVVDVGSSLTRVTLSTLASVSLVLLVTAPNMASVKSVNQFLAQLPSFDLDRNKMELVVNALDADALNQDETARSIGVQPLISLRSDSKACVIALNHGIPVITSYRGSRFSQDLRRLADMLTERLSLGQVASVKQEASVKPAFSLFRGRR